MSTHKHGNLEILKDDFKCPICFCSTHFGQTIICSKCEFWFHWNCVGITSENSLVKNKKEHYFCYKCKFDLKDLKVVVEKMDLSRFYSFKCNVCAKKFMKSVSLSHLYRIYRESKILFVSYYFCEANISEIYQNYYTPQIWLSKVY